MRARAMTGSLPFESYGHSGEKFSKKPFENPCHANDHRNPRVGVRNGGAYTARGIIAFDLTPTVS